MRSAPPVRRFRGLPALCVLLLVLVAGLIVQNQVRVYRGRQARAADRLLSQMQEDATRVRARMASEARAREMSAPIGSRRHVRQMLLDLLWPVALSNCRLERWGEPHDGGYFVCANLLGDVEAGYSYGISGYDQWGCDVSTKLGVPVHQYDCFNTTRPRCPGGQTVFHEECVGPARSVQDGRPFDTIARQLRKNGDGARRVVLKIDVEGAEWDSFLHAPDAVLDRIDQLVVEFHRVSDEDDKYLMVVARLARFFHVAHLHFNNFSCIPDLDPLPAWAYEVLFVNKRLGVPNPFRQVSLPHPLDAPNNPAAAECRLPPRQPGGNSSRRAATREPDVLRTNGR